MAFFDLDETLTDEDTDTLWALWRSHRSFRGWAERAWLAKLYRDYRRGKMDIDEYMRYQRFRTRSLSPGEFGELSERFFRESGESHIYREARELVAALGKKGCRTVMLTSQHDVIARPFAASLGMDLVIANRFEHDGRRFLGPARPYCIGEGKVVLGRQCAGDAGISLDRCAFFGDSVYDAAFMEQVGLPFAVNPDAQLGEKAARNGWQVVRFGRAR